MIKLKPFDLKTALNGEPVKLRNGSKAYVRHHETELETDILETLLGYIEGIGLWSWGVGGESRSCGGESQYDIIGMYLKTRTINGFEVPAPETEELALGRTYFAPHMQAHMYFTRLPWDGDDCDRMSLKRGVVFLSIEDAIANAKAMLGIDPNKPSTD